MQFEDIRQLTRAVPFQPFRVHLSNGETYNIRHPDEILATYGTVHIAAPSPEHPAFDYGSVRIVSLNHILKIESLPGSAPAQPGSNGPINPSGSA